MCHQHHQWNELVCLKQNQVCIRCPSFLDEHLSSTKRGRDGKEGGWGLLGVGACQRSGSAVKEEPQENAGIPSFTGIWLVFPLCKNKKKNKLKKRNQKKVKQWSKNKKRRGGSCLLRCGVGCFVYVVIFIIIIIIVLFCKATLGFDAVVVVGGLAAATGVGFRAPLLLLVRLRHTPPGGEVEGHAPRPRQNPVSLHAVALQLVKRRQKWGPERRVGGEKKGGGGGRRLKLLLTCSVLVWNSLSSSSVRGRKLSSFSGYSCHPMAFSNLQRKSGINITPGGF